MSPIEQQALALINEVRAAEGFEDSTLARAEEFYDTTFPILCLLIERQEAFKRDVSDFASGVRAYMQYVKALAWDQECARFIIPPPLDEELRRPNIAEAE